MSELEEFWQHDPRPVSLGPCGACGIEIVSVVLPGERLHHKHVDEPDDGHPIVFGVPSPPDGYTAEQRRLWQLRKEGDEVEDAEAKAVPPPEFPAQPAHEDEIPRGAQQVIKAAEAGGWDIRVTYSRGPWVRADRWEMTKIADCVLVRAARRVTREGDEVGEYAVACWLDGAFELAYHSYEDTVRERVNSNDLKKRLKSAEA